MEDFKFRNVFHSGPSSFVGDRSLNSTLLFMRTVSAFAPPVSLVRRWTRIGLTAAHVGMSELPSRGWCFFRDWLDRRFAETVHFLLLVAVASQRRYSGHHPGPFLQRIWLSLGTSARIGIRNWQVVLLWLPCTRCCYRTFATTRSNFRIAGPVFTAIATHGGVFSLLNFCSW